MRHILAAALPLLVPAALAAQLPDPSIRSLGMAGANSAVATGWEAVALNPALLAASGRPGWSLGLPRIQTEIASNAWGMSELRTYGGKTLSDADKQALLDQIDSTLDTRAQFGVTPIGLQIGPFALSIASAGDLQANVGKDFAELLLFGNAHRTTPFTLTGSRADGWAATTAGLSYAMGFRTGAGRLSAGATFKKVWGNGLGSGREITSTITSTPNFNARLVGHTVYTSYPDSFNFSSPLDFMGGTGSPGSGYGVDLGAVWELSGITVAASVMNAVHNMDWDASRFTYERVDYRVFQDGTGNTTDTTIRSELSGAEIDTNAVARALRDSLVADGNFSRQLRTGVSLKLGGIRLAGDAAIRLSDGIDRPPASAVAVGAEYVLMGLLPLRAGFGTDFDGTNRYSAGVGLYLGPVRIDVGGSQTVGTKRDVTRVGAGLGLVF